MSEPETPKSDRRDFLATATTVAMGGGIVASYGTFFAFAGRFLYPANDTRTAWMFVARTADLKTGGSIPFRTPGGAEIVVARKGDGDSAADFLALSSVCPHLGCQVHWESANNRFFCPCHSGVFSPEGMGIEGPPEGLELLRYPLKVEDGILYMEVEMEQIAGLQLLEKPGHDSCLGPV